MKSKLIGAVAAFVVMFGLAGLWHDLLMGDYYSSILQGAARPDPIESLIGLGYLVASMVMGFLYPIGYQGGTALAEGARFGAVLGVFWWLPAMIVFAGIYEQTLVNALVDGAWHVVEGGAGGIAIATVHARMGGAAEPAA